MTDKKDPIRPLTASIDNDDDEIMTSSSALDLNLAKVNADLGPTGIPQRQSSPAERVTFSNLEALVPERIQQPSAQELVGRPIQSDPSVIEVKPPSGRRWSVIAVVVLLMGFVLWVAHGNQWQWSALIDDPGASIQAALGHQPKAPVVQAPTESAVKIETTVGALVIDRERIEPVTGPAGRGGIAVAGTVRNQSNRIQHAITLKVSVLDAKGRTLKWKKTICCKIEGGSGAQVPETRLKPGQNAAFKVIFPAQNLSVDTLKPKVEITFAETQKAQ